MKLLKKLLAPLGLARGAEHPHPAPAVEIPTFTVNPKPRDRVAVLLDPVDGKPCWIVNPLPEGHGRFTELKGEFPFVEPDGWPEEDFGKVFRSQAITAAKSLYWSLVAPK